MSNISGKLPLTEFSTPPNNKATRQAAAYVREQSVNFREKLDTNLVLETKDGDKVTLASNSYSQMSASLYDSRGIIQTDSGFAAAGMSQREITLASGQSFSFTVEGQLSEEEFKDIESLLAGLDGVIAEMKEGDMEDAFGQALGLGGYDTVSNFTADIRYEQAYVMESAMAAAALQTHPAGSEFSGQADLAGLLPEAAAEQTGAAGNKYGHLEGFDKFFEKLASQLEKHEDRIIGLAQNPINQLFKHHLHEMKDDESGGPYTVIETAMEDINALIDEMMGSRFDEQVAEAVEERAEGEAEEG